MIKYIGSKRRLVPLLTGIAEAVDARSGLDLFTGTTRVAQGWRRAGLGVTAVDTARYAEVLAQTYVAWAPSPAERAEIGAALRTLGALPGEDGYLTDTFCRRARYFHPENGVRLDAIRRAIARDHAGTWREPILLTSLMEAADRVDSTAGVQMAYLKQWAPRALKPLELRVPAPPDGPPGRVVRADAVEVVGGLGRFDVAYLDPPYNQHRYFTNYHVWETLVAGDEPEHYGVACKRVDAREPATRSVFNQRRQMPGALRTCVGQVDARVLVLSYNDEAWLSLGELVDMTAARGPVAVLTVDSKRYVGAQIGIHNQRGAKVGTVSHLRNTEYVLVAGELTAGQRARLAGVALEHGAAVCALTPLREPDGMTADAPLWTPPPERVAASQLEAFRRRVVEEHGVDLPDSRALHRWSIDHPGELWRDVWTSAGVVGDPGEPAFDPGDGTMLAARFFPQARLNLAENLLVGPADESDPAIVFVREDGRRRTIGWGQLRTAVAAAAAGLRAAGVGPGDRVAAWTPNLPETVITFLATAAIGAVFSSTSADFGTAGVIDRFGQIEPTVLLAADGYLYGGKRFDCLGRLAELRAALPSVREVVVAGNLADEPDLRLVPGTRSFADFLGPDEPPPATFERLPFDHPAAILYSSGTTGVPKCIVHRAGGLLLKHLSEQRLHCDVRPGDRVFYFTTTGWMMWNWLVSALAARATIVLFDGNPFHPGPSTLFDVAERLEVTLLGVSAKFIDSCHKAGLRPRDTHRLPNLRTICSTGSPLGAEGFDWVYDAVAPDVHLASISGGTDLCGCFVAGDPTRPVWAGEIQGPVLGMAVDVYDERGLPLAEGKGELVCTRPFPTMPVGFWGDTDGVRYRQAYFDRFPGVWAHGDYASWTEHGGMVIYGRSDATLNASGVRIGTAEIYRQVEQLPEVLEAIAVGQEWDGDTRIVLFVRLADGVALDDELQARIRSRLRERCSPRHVPARIAAVTDIPRTRSGKITELTVTDVVNGRQVRNTEALANPEALAEYRDRPELTG